MANLKIVLLDDEENTRKSLSTFLAMHGYEVETAAKASRALKLLDSGGFQVLLTDVRMPEMDGIRLTDTARERFPSLTILVMSAYGNVKDAVQAMKKGAFDYLTKPIDPDELLLSLRKIDERHALLREVKSLRQKLGVASPYEGIVGNSEAMRSVYTFIETAAKSGSSVLLTGETGTGKDIVARAIHLNSGRKRGPLVAVSCGALPDTLIESELFGHLKGAFTGAVSGRNGKIRSASGGTLFLDEIGTLSLSSQVKLLRVLETKKFEPLGGDETIEVDIRIIAATNEDLLKAVQEGRFREDLYYRLNVLNMEIPPLRERREDIVPLVRHILRKMNRENIKVSTEAMNILIRHRWPGNVRELENILERSVASLQSDTLMPESLPSIVAPPDIDRALSRITGKEPAFNAQVAQFEKYLIEEKLRQTRGNVTKAARELDLPLRSLRRKLEKYSLKAKEFKKRK